MSAVSLRGGVETCIWAVRFFVLFEGSICPLPQWLDVYGHEVAFSVKRK